MKSEERAQALDALEWIFKVADDHGKYTCSDEYELVKSALHSVEAEKEPEWIRCEERNPRGGEHEFVWVHHPDGRILLTPQSDVRWLEPECRWMPTGLHCPAPPEHKPE